MNMTFQVDTDDQGEILETNIVFMAKLEKDGTYEATFQEEKDSSPSYDIDAEYDDAFNNQVNTIY